MKLKNYMRLYRTAIVKIAFSSVLTPLPLLPLLSPPFSLSPPLSSSSLPLSPLPSPPLSSQVRVDVEEALQDVADVIRNPEIAAIKGEYDVMV